MLPRELDFCGEAKNAEKTQNLFKDNPSIRVPDVYHEYSNVGKFPYSSSNMKRIKFL